MIKTFLVSSYSQLLIDGSVFLSAFHYKNIQSRTKTLGYFTAIFLMPKELSVGDRLSHGMRQ